MKIIRVELIPDEVLRVSYQTPHRRGTANFWLGAIPDATDRRVRPEHDHFVFESDVVVAFGVLVDDLSGMVLAALENQPILDDGGS